MNITRTEAFQQQTLLTVVKLIPLQYIDTAWGKNSDS